VKEGALGPGLLNNFLLAGIGAAAGLRLIKIMR
jgi:hypothetical protein